jgi:eukaryotic-like serine/threonine-protein kinase
LIIPAYSGSLERGPSPLNLPPSQARERALKWSMDLGRSVDYLATRPDIDITRLAFYGVSTGAAQGPRLIAVDPRFKTAVLASGGLHDDDPPEVDPYNFAPRVHVPVLMLNGRDDFIFPMRTHQVPLFEALGTPESDKVFRSYGGGHANLLTRPELIGEILNWFDKYLGAARSRQPADAASSRR